MLAAPDATSHAVGRAEGMHPIRVRRGEKETHVMNAHEDLGVGHSRHLGWLSALGLLSSLACATSPAISLPPIGGAGTQAIQPGRFVWLDLVTPDLESAQAFYGGLFGWTFERGSDYVTVLHAGAPIAGMVSREVDEGSLWLSSLSVADVDRAAERVGQAGGVVRRGPLDAGERGRMALVTDPGGALLLLLRATGGDPPDVRAEPGAWFWRELWTHDVSEALAFYATMADYERREVSFRGGSYTVLETDGEARAGVAELLDKEVRSNWLPYVRVKDPDRTLTRAETLGARVLVRDENAAILLDPNGAPLGIQRWPLEGGKR
jgi:predicted enzyme related to lactoylglutathione lyase